MVINVRVLLTGATGLLGYNIIYHLVEKGFDVIATYRNTVLKAESNVSKWVKIDLENLEEIVKTLGNIRPDVIIHSAAYTDVDGCEVNKDKALKINYFASRAIASSAAKIGSTVVYVSTDYVFDGDKGGYREDDAVNPINYYGLTKLLGEVAISSLLPENSLIVRTSGLYGFSPTGKKNFGVQALENLVKGKEVYAFYDQYLSPTYAFFLAEKIVECVEKRVTGVLHIAGERLSRYEFAKALARIAGVDETLVKLVSMRDAKLVARRPRDSSLDTSRAKELGLNPPSTIESLNHFVKTYKMVIGGKNAI